ncbi:4-hydroxy-tetrahydrodipicolinate synthase [bacterium]|nr:4-hydroxy-tetrahydrodipicolinate synthase [bacterium]
MFSGSIVPIITPFKEDGSIDYETLSSLIEFHIQKGSHGLLPVGTTGESATLNHKEHRDVVRFVIEKVAKRIPVIAGCGSNSTEEAIGLAKAAKEDGANGILSITPYYNKPTQEGLVAHFTEIANAVDIPIILYNVPGRTGVNMLPETVKKLSDIKNIVGVKEASGNLAQAAEIKRLCDGKIALFCGEDSLVFPMMAIGGSGCISASANIAPEDFASMVEEANNRNFDRARSLYYKLLPLCTAMFWETNPVPVKESLKMMEIIPSAKVRLPLVSLKEETREKIKALLATYNLLK